MNGIYNLAIGNDTLSNAVDANSNTIVGCSAY